MTVHWRDHQDRAAEIFRRLGHSVSMEAVVHGARAKHVVDVYVQGSHYGLEFAWVVECKAWRARVPKEKVLVLAAVVQDVGADRGILIAESGFQIGAIRAAENTNITLSSLGDLAQITRKASVDATVGALHWRLEKARARLAEIKRSRYRDEFIPPTTEQLGRLYVLQAALADALDDKFPNVYAMEGGKRLAAETFEELVDVAEGIIKDAETWTPP